MITIKWGSCFVLDEMVVIVYPYYKGYRLYKQVVSIILMNMKIFYLFFFLIPLISNLLILRCCETHKFGSIFFINCLKNNAVYSVTETIWETLSSILNTRARSRNVRNRFGSKLYDQFCAVSCSEWIWKRMKILNLEKTSGEARIITYEVKFLLVLSAS